jgi:hypothetical protein
MREKDDLDLLLDSALTTYADPGPDSGLEQRVLSAMAAAQTAGERRRLGRPRRWWPAWAIAVPVAACLLVLWLSIPRSVHAPSIQPQASQSHPPLSSPGSHVASGSRPPAHRALREHDPIRVTHAVPSTMASASGTSPLPKLDVFPTPKPLTAQERALLVVAIKAPPQAREAMVEAQEQNNGPHRIAAIHIPPLEPLNQSQP